MATEKLTREEKAQQLFDDGVRPVKTEDGWEVSSTSYMNGSYEVTRDYDVWSCTCPDFLYRHQLMCKHITLVQLCESKKCEVNGTIEIHDDRHDIHLKKNIVVVC
jgi:hypothetical protein